MRGTTILPAVIVAVVLATLAWLWVRDRTSHVATYGKVPSDIRAIEFACEDYARDHEGEFPDDLEQLVEPNATGRRYLSGARTVPLDPWRRPYLYAPTDEHCRHPRIWTFGCDGVPGGEGDDRDVDNRRRSADFDAP